MHRRRRIREDGGHHVLDPDAVNGAKAELRGDYLEGARQGFWEFLTDRNGPLRKATSELKSATYWAPISNSGRAYIWAYRSHSKKPYVVAGISLYNAGASAVWYALKANQSLYEQDFGEHLKWHGNKAGTAFHIQTNDRPAAPEAEDWPSHHQWLVERMVRFDKQFSARIEQLIEAFDAGQIGPPDLGQLS